MSRKVLIVAVVLGLLVTTLAAPAMAAPPKAHNVASTQTETWAGTGGSPSVSQSAGSEARIGIWPSGGCETGSAGGCPIHS